MIISYGSSVCNGTALSYAVHRVDGDPVVIARFITVAHYEAEGVENIVQVGSARILLPSGHILEKAEQLESFAEYAADCDMNAYVWVKFRVQQTEDLTQLQRELATVTMLATRWDYENVNSVIGATVEVVTLGTASLIRNVAKGRIIQAYPIEGGVSYSFDIDCSVINPDTQTGPGSSGSIVYVRIGGSSNFVPLALHFGSTQSGKTNTCYSIDRSMAPTPACVKKWTK